MDHPQSRVVSREGNIPIRTRLDQQMPRLKPRKAEPSDRAREWNSRMVRGPMMWSATWNS